MPTLTTLGGWAAVITIGALYYYLTTRKTSDRVRRLSVLKSTGKSIEARREPKGKRSRKDSAPGTADQDIRFGDKGQKKKRLQATKSDREDEKVIASNLPWENDRDNEIDNQEFARQLSSAKAGTLLAAKAEPGARQKSIKQSRAQEKPVTVETSSDNATAPSSAAGGDADDDQSPLNSPELNAIMVTSPAMNGDVSDMLEASGPGPSVLRITDPNTPSRQKKAKPQPTFEPVETKKQRQNRKKAEAKKVAREEDEKDRKMLMEKQRRTAREAEGRPAKDGSASLAASNAPSTSAWASTPGVLNGSKGVESQKVELLDTYEPASTKAAGALSSEGHYSESELAGSDWQKLLPSLPSEEEQMRFAIEDSDNWKTVKSKEKRVQKNKATRTEDKESSTDEHEGYGVPPLIAPTGPGKKWGMTLVHVESNGEVVEYEKEVQDSEWEVA